MSIRTIIEVNHDLLAALDNPEALQEMVRSLVMGEYMPKLNSGELPEIAPGVRVLMQRHHTSSVTIQSDWAKVEL